MQFLKLPRFFITVWASEKGRQFQILPLTTLSRSYNDCTLTPSRENTNQLKNQIYSQIQVLKNIQFQFCSPFSGTSTAELKRNYSGLRMLPLPILIIFTLAFNVGMGSLTWVVATEILPFRSRRWTHTLANVTSNVCWFIVTKTYRDISTKFGLYVPFFIYGSVCLFGFVFIYVFLPETRGKTPEETAKAFRWFILFFGGFLGSRVGRIGIDTSWHNQFEGECWKWVKNHWNCKFYEILKKSISNDIFYKNFKDLELLVDWLIIGNAAFSKSAKKQQADFQTLL